MWLELALRLPLLPQWRPKTRQMVLPHVAWEQGAWPGPGQGVRAHAAAPRWLRPRLDELKQQALEAGCCHRAAALELRACATVRAHQRVGHP